MSEQAGTPSPSQDLNGGAWWVEKFLQRWEIASRKYCSR